MENRKYHNCGPGRARTMIIFHTRVSSYRSTFWKKKLACCPQQELRTMHSEVFTPHPLMPSKFEKTRPSRKSPGTYCKVMSSAQEHLSVICAKFLPATSGSNKGVKIVPKALSGAIARHSGDGNFTQCLTMKLWSGAKLLAPVSSPSVKVTRASFRPGRLLWPNGA